MNARKLMLPILAAALAFTIGGPVTAAGSNVETIEAMDFNSDNGQLIGYRYTPTGPALGYFTHAGHTAHLVGTPNHPPSPIAPSSHACSGLTRAWNQSVNRGEPAAPNRTRILSRLAQHQCHLDITTDSSTDPPTLLTISPLD